jgi:hypothetical protein
VLVGDSVSVASTSGNKSFSTMMLIMIQPGF